jgi:hypothetical protein
MTQPNIDFTRQELYCLRLKPFVEQEVNTAKDQVLLEKHSLPEWVDYIVTTLLERLSLERLMTIRDADLQGMVGRLMSLELVAGMLADLSPEQMRIFEECLVRR